MYCSYACIILCVHAHIIAMILYREKSSSNYAINEILIVLGHGALVSGTSVTVLKSAKKSQLPLESVAVFPLK